MKQNLQNLHPAYGLLDGVLVVLRDYWILAAMLLPNWLLQNEQAQEKSNAGIT